MKRHIDWEMVDSEDQLDRSHLEACPECQKKYHLHMFLVRQARSARPVEPPPFFARKVARSIHQASQPMWFYFRWAAARLAPVLALLILATGLLIINVVREPELPDTVILDDSAASEVSFENMINSLHKARAEDSGE